VYVDFIGNFFIVDF